MNTNINNVIFDDEVTMQNVGRAFRETMLIAMALTDASYNSSIKEDIAPDEVVSILKSQDSVTTLLDNALKYKTILEFFDKVQDK